MPGGLFKIAGIKVACGFLPNSNMDRRNIAPRQAPAAAQAEEEDVVRKYFGTDGIRGRANGVITAELALRVGQATGTASGAASIATAWSSARIRGFPAT